MAVAVVELRGLKKESMQCMDCPPGQKNWPLLRGGRCGEMAVSGGSTV